MVPGTRTGQYVTGTGSPVGEFVSTQDFAVAVLDEAESPAHRGNAFTIASADAAKARA